MPTAAHLSTLLERHSNSGILIDANLLLLLFIGTYRPELVGTYSRLKQYERDDFTVVHNFANSFRQIVTTPHILAEVNSLSGKIDIRFREDYFTTFRSHVDIIQEEHEAAKDLCSEPRLGALGLTDVGIVRLARTGCLVLTDDFALSGYLASIGADVLNYNHIRSYRWGLGRR